MYTAHFGSKQLVGMEGIALLERLLPIHEQIQTLHLWGRGPSGGAHGGNLDGLFDPATNAKKACLGVLRRMFAEGRPRFLVAEVGSKGGKLADILGDLQQAGFVFESNR
jgi:hypothetical protein